MYIRCVNNLQKRVISSLVMVIVFGVAVGIHHIGLLLTFGLVVFLTTTEYMAMVKPGKSALVPAILSTLVYGGLYLATQTISINQFLLFMGVLCLYHIYILVELLVLKSRKPSQYWIPGLFYLTLAASCIHYFQYFEKYQLDLFLLLALIWASDTGSYFMGKFFGKRKLAPSISPSKTVEGFFGGWLLGFVFNSILVACGVINGWILFIALIVHVLVVLGDLIESKLKRITKIKDSGSIIPGHGGFLDRCDGLLFALPFAILLYHYFYNAV